LYIRCYFLDQLFFYPFLFSLPISHFFISLFLVFTLLLIFNLILTLTKNGLIQFQQLSNFSHHKHQFSVFYSPICDYLVTHFVRWWPGDLV